MWFKVFFSVFTFAMLSACETTSYVSDKKPREASKFCRESTKHQSTTNCFSDAKPLGGKYLLLNNKVYWTITNSYWDSACVSGSGDPSAFFVNALSPACWIGGGGSYSVNEYRLYFVTKYSPEFRVLGEHGGVPKTRWQKSQLSDYALDRDSVYFEGRKIREAKSHEFSVIFPFGDEGEWDRLHVSKSGELIFINGLLAGRANLSGLQMFKLAQCPEHGLRCTSKKDLYDQFAARVPIVGWVGSDIVVLHENNISVFKGLMSPDAFVFSSIKRTYLYSGGKFYEFQPDKSDGVSGETKVIDMDMSFYNSHSF